MLIYMNKVLVGLVVIAIVVVFFIVNGTDTSSMSSDVVVPKDSKSLSDKSIASTIATQWKWDKNNEKISPEYSSNQQSLPFTPQSVHNALQAIKFDENNNIILDHDALISLDEALERIYKKMDGDTLTVLKNIIQEHLPGKTGEQTAQIIGDYYQFLKAKDQFSELHEAASDAGMETLESIEQNEILYTELQALREAHLGSEVTAGLFRVSDANSKYILQSMKLELDNSLTTEEKALQHQKIITEHTEQSINIVNWPSRYQVFLNLKQSIVEASIDEGEKQKQVSQLLVQQFNRDELQRIEHLNLDQI